MTDLLEFARATALEAAALLRERYESELSVSSKSTTIDLVTDVDHQSEALILGRIRARYPEHRILAEETAQDASVLNGATPVWLVDPLDGTVNYAHGFPVFAVSLALVVEGRPVLGVTVDPLRGDVFAAERGAGAWVGDKRLRVTSRARLPESLLATGFPYARATLRDNNIPAFNHFLLRARGVRRAGAATLDLAWVAAGRLDGYWEAHLSPWDFAAGWLFVEEAGGRCTDYTGAPWSLSARPARIVATNGLIHDQVLAELTEARRDIPPEDAHA